ncbi:hypothetical protein IQ250_01270 [Pseudanabaenaceae cyanobacterium LEGE 13415]|nr:hypothetical protein [Pseudanabaenaceae cyanobacterium LEGE 13415]
MGVQLIPVLEGYDKYYSLKRSSPDWKSIPHRLEELDAIAKQLEVEPLTSFISMTRDETAFGEEDMAEFESESEFIDGAWYYQGSLLWTIEPQWTLAKVGLVTVRGLLDRIRACQPEFSADSDNGSDEEQDFRSVIYELEAMERIISQARQENRRFRLYLSV